ncbi:DNA recombination protein RmuC, partial [Desulfobacterales bacterium HSG16]|nr:DNA recombination protein RmuC [Desulfobacterales bacterium HSG16]
AGQKIGDLKLRLAKAETENAHALNSLGTTANKYSESKRESERLAVLVAEHSSREESLTARIFALEPSYEKFRQENEDLKIELARLKEAGESDARRLEWVENAGEKMKNSFNALAGQALKANSDLFLDQAGRQVEGFLNQTRTDWKTHKAQVQHLMDPVKDRLYQLDEHVRELEQKREGAYQGLWQHMEQLARNNQELKTAATNLSHALRSPTVRGRWGEMQLRRVVELSGMAKHVMFEEQALGTDQKRPDMIIHLPDSGILPVDAKMPIEAFLKAIEAVDEETKARQYAAHVRAIRNRIRDLGLRKYQERFDPSPDFVVMFIPNEACLGAAFEHDPDLLEYSFGQKVLLTTPMTLMALLKSTAYGWQQQKMAENAKQIAEQGRELYNRLNTFSGHLASLGKMLNKTTESFNQCIGSMDRRLFPMARRFVELGIAEKKPILPFPVENRAIISDHSQPGQSWPEPNPANNPSQRKATHVHDGKTV